VKVKREGTGVILKQGKPDEKDYYIEGIKAQT